MSAQIVTPRHAAWGLRTVSAFALAIVSLLYVATPATAATSNNDASLEKSIVLIGITWTGYVGYPTDDGDFVWSDEVTANTTCTGWFASTEGDIVTAGHCVDPAGSKAMLIDQFLINVGQTDLIGQVETSGAWYVEGVNSGDPVSRTVRVIQPNIKGAIITQATIAQVVDFQPFDEGDFTLLKVANLDQETPPLRIARNAPEVGATLTAIGYPGAVMDNTDTSRLRASFKSGTASSQQIGTNGIPGTEVNADISPGMSGGPTVDENGNVLGVNSYQITGSSTQNFNFITDTIGLRKFLTKNTVNFVSESNTSQNGVAGIIMTFVIIFVVLVVLAIAGLLAWLLLRRRHNNSKGGIQPPVIPPTYVADEPVFVEPVMVIPPSPVREPVIELPTPYREAAVTTVDLPEPAQSSADETIYCRKCGTGYPADTMFCSKDGASLKS